MPSAVRQRRLPLIGALPTHYESGYHPASYGNHRENYGKTEHSWSSILQPSFRKLSRLFQLSTVCIWQWNGPRSRIAASQPTALLFESAHLASIQPFDLLHPKKYHRQLLRHSFAQSCRKWSRNFENLENRSSISSSFSFCVDVRVDVAATSFSLWRLCSCRPDSEHSDLGPRRGQRQGSSHSGNSGTARQHPPQRFRARRQRAMGCYLNFEKFDFSHFFLLFRSRHDLNFRVSFSSIRVLTM